MLRAAHSVLQLLAVTALVTVAPGCGGSRDKSTGPASATGTYALRSVDGDPVPSMLTQDPGYSFEITSGSLTLDEDGSYAVSLDWRENVDGTLTSDTDEDFGAYTRTSDAFSFVSSVNGTTLTGSLSGSTMTVVDEDWITYVFRK
jgi:hypothetical protein